MGKKDIRVIPWKYVATLQFVITAGCVNLTVTDMQYVLPFSPFFVNSTTSLSMNEVGYISGGLLSSFLLGRALATPFWIYVADACGRRAVLSMCFMFTLVLTMFFGLCSTLLTAVVVRFCLGLFSPVYSLVQSILRELSSPCMESMPSVAVVTDFNVIASHALGLLIGAFMSPELTTNNSPTVQKFVFLSPSLVSAAITLFAFIAFFVDFPETLPLAVELQKRAKQAASQPAAKNLPGKYVELAETGNGQTEEGKQDTHGDVLTERKEHIDEDDGEEIPNYLMHFASQRPSVEKTEETAQEKELTLSTKLARFFSPRHADIPKVNLGPRPNTARANTFAHPLPEIDEPKEPVAERKSQVPAIMESKTTNEKEEIKRTHISFFEEDLDPAEMSSSATPQAHLDYTLEDKHRRKTTQGVLRNPAFRHAAGQYLTALALVSAVREAAVVWLVADRPGLTLSVEGLGLTLLAAAAIGQTMHTVLMTRIVFFHPLNQYGFFTCLSLSIVVTALPYADCAESRLVQIGSSLFALTMFEYLSSTLLTIESLKVGDSVSPEHRESAIRWSCFLGSTMKAAAVLSGPALMSASLSDRLSLDYHYMFTVAAGGLLLFSGFLAWDKRYFPRFDEAPYEV